MAYLESIGCAFKKKYLGKKNILVKFLTLSISQVLLCAQQCARCYGEGKR